ncbi:FAD-binding and (Fe-S)-binding domain-containing protein [Paucibacter sp. O1-1]|nr:FAD-binding oxidoreductase [Paucibacter sp. O1-1]MDA3825064.1 FAD-binding and (Fe-S)-binding domain-containing protein [Paucibacter sp. O1-1]
MNQPTIQPISSPISVGKIYRLFCQELRQAGFEGEIGNSLAERVVLATDNSIYQRMPQAAVYPRHAADVQCLAQLAAEARFRRIVLTPRGGGTGTNGQSLTDGIVVDLSRHMNRILEIDAVARRVRVEAGVVKDQLNAALKPLGLFFAPELSTSNRATIGGMVNTDASGQGSCTYGKTRDHVLSLDCVYLGGARHESMPVSDAELSELCAFEGSVGAGYRTARRIHDEQADLIAARFPKLNRCLTGYDLAHLRDASGMFNLNSVLCGSEGSLGFMVEATLRVLPIPRFTTLVNIRYASFMGALRDAQALMQQRPLSIETVDSTVLKLAMNDIVWQHVSPFFPDDPDQPTLGINLVEFSGDDEEELLHRIRSFEEHLHTDCSVQRLGHTIADRADAVESVYAMRKRAVGLLGNVEGEARPQPFVEDTAVPPEHLADYITEFRALLDAHGLRYGMFGHVDAGVLHVRPALDMKDANDAALVRPITEAVARLTQKYGGLLWGEHGKGLRSEFAPAFFGDLYPSLQSLKAAFDPHNQLNPGKIATPAGSHQALTRVDEVPLRGDLDRQIDERVWQSFGTALKCNGNGACYNFDPDDAMCPSWKATRERVHSPKGRASLLREWLRLQGAANVDVLLAERNAPSFLTGFLARWRNSRARTAGGSEDFAHEVYDAMAGCLACKSCAGQCPVKVSVPEFRSRFLALYHTRYLRPLKDYLIGSLEYTIPYLARAPALYNLSLSAPLVQRWLEKRAGMVDSPLLSRFDWRQAIKRWNVAAASARRLERLTPVEKQRSVIFVQDAFTRYFESPVAASFIELASRLGYRVYLAPFRPNGKPLHVQGFLHAFDKAARENNGQLQRLAQSGVALVGLDPAMTLVYRQEYRKVPGIGDSPDVLLPQEWLLKAMPESRPRSSPRSFTLMSHCTEKTNVPGSSSDWVRLFERVGLTLSVEPTGCCGMSGTFGHEARNAGTSQTIFEQSWAKVVDSRDEAELLATGYSCRSQVARFRDKRLRHPIEAMLESVELT